VAVDSAVLLVFGRTFRHFVHVINKIFFDVQIPHKAFSNKSDRNGIQETAWSLAEGEASRGAFSPLSLPVMVIDDDFSGRDRMAD